MAQQTISDTLIQVCNSIENKLCAKHITLEMNNIEKEECKRYFFSKAGIPGIIGVVDGSHIQIIRPHTNEHLFFNRKLKHSINAMMICDHKMRIRSVNGRYGGASHDAHIWNLSKEREFLLRCYQNGDKSSWIIGDSGYTLEPWLMTPYRSADENSAESRYNDKLSISRSIIERVFGILKARFRCLLSARELHYKAEKAAQFLNVCCALHNICLLYNVELDIELPPITGEDDVPTIAPEVTDNTMYANIAKRLRDQIKNNLNTLM